MLCWMKFVIFIIFFFPIISLFRLASKFPSYLKSITSLAFHAFQIICLEFLAWTKIIIMLLLLPLRIIFIPLLQPLMPLIWWLSLCRFAYADKDNPTVISSSSKKKNALSFDYKLMILSQVQVKSEFAHLTPQLHHLHSSNSIFHKCNR